MVTPAIPCDHEWRAPGEETNHLYAKRPPVALRFLGMLECAVCELPAIRVQANDGREWLGVFGSRFAATTGIHQPRQWIPSGLPELTGAPS